MGVDENPIIDKMKEYGTTSPGKLDYTKLKDLKEGNYELPSSKEKEGEPEGETKKEKGEV